MLWTTFLLLALSQAAPALPRFMYPAPPPSAIDVTMNVPYGDGLQMDVYRPRNAAGPLPVFIFFNIATGAERSNFFYRPWAEIAASQGLIAVLPDLTFEQNAREFDALVAHIRTNAQSLGADPAAIAVFAGSGNVSRALPLLQAPSRASIASAVMYYGSAEVPSFRADLPLLFVRAGLDRPALNKAITSLASRASDENAPVSLLNYPGGYHAFEIANDNRATRDVIDQTIAFVKQTTSAGYRSALTAGLPDATAAGHVTGGRFDRAAAIYGGMLATRPDDARLRLAYAEALLGHQQFKEACAEFEKLRQARLGPRDRGIPAARACMQSGDADAAVGWIASIPERFRPRELETDPMFAPLRTRADFRALFPSRD
ncbi:MAG: tetratricopeptide repeat protein [Acidobacteriota bacterium]|nr:tetratricopeptide repeat protein [Acidobacteriota bacterium]